MPEIRAIQDQISDFVIGSELKGITDDARASELNLRLNEILKDKKILIILDDIWSVLDLVKVGIPTDNKGCKILMTSRELDLLLYMGSRKNFYLQVLSKEESMSLFEKKVIVVKDRKMAEEILGRCAGFPLLIVTIAGLLKNKNEDLDASWEDVLTQLKQFDNQEVRDKVYPILELSYDHLPSKKTKQIFLLYGICSWSSFKLTDLLWYSFGLGLLKKYTTISEARTYLTTLIGELKDCSLLDIDEHGDIRMHDLVREVAISIARKEGLAYRNNDDDELTQWPSGNEISNFTKVSMIWINIKNLPKNLGCPNVEYLLLFKRDLINIPDSAFRWTQQLKVVHFRELKFVSMPRSVYSLENLHTLYLEDCKFSNLNAAIGKLKNLEILSFRESDLEALPSEVGQLARLKLLDLRMCHKLNFIPANVISKLTLLEELLMSYSFTNWEIEEHSSGSNASLSELKCLSHLTSLEIFVPDVRALPGSFFSMYLERYEIMIGSRTGFRRRDLDFGITKSILVDLSASIDMLEKARNLLMEAEVVCLNGINGMTNLLDSEGFSKWKELSIMMFSKWKELSIMKSCTLQQIFDWGTTISFKELKTLDISDCLKLKSLFSVSAVGSLPQLEEINIKRCNEMEALFVVFDEERTQVVEFPCLRNLVLEFLPKLKCFLDVRISKSSKIASTTMKLMSLFNGKVALPSLETLELRSIDNIEMIWSSGPLNVLPSLRKLHTLVVEKCVSLEEIFDLHGMDQENEQRFGVMSELQELKLSELPKLRHVWNEDPLGILGEFENLSVLKVHNCGNLTHIFTLSVALGLVCLERLQVKGCGLVEVIINQQGEDEKPTADQEDHCTSIFPSLDSVELEDLSSLKEFCSGVDCVLICPHLTTITGVGCPGMRILGGSSTGSSSTEHHPVNGLPHDQTQNKPALLIFNDQVKISGLLKLDVQWNSSMNKAWHGLIPRSFLHSLEYVKLTGFPADHELLPLDFVQAMPNLEKFLISDSFYKQILPRFVRDAGSLEKLTHLELFNLPELCNLIEEEGSKSFSVFQHLEVLEVSKCKRLTRLMTSATARGLVHLKKIVVKDCKEMAEILSSNGGGEEGDEIAFDQLKSLELKGLSCLTTFSSGNGTFSFPLLKDMIIVKCPHMKTFSKNDPGTPNLWAVQIAEIEDEDPWRWEGGLNRTIEKLYTEMNPSSTT